MDLIQEAKNRGYKKGTPIRYVPHAIDYVEGNYFEINDDGDVVAYNVPKESRKSFDDFRHDVLYESATKQWTEIVDLSKRTAEQIRIDKENELPTL